MKEALLIGLIVGAVGGYYFSGTLTHYQPWTAAWNFAHPNLAQQYASAGSNIGSNLGSSIGGAIGNFEEGWNALQNL